MSERAALGTNVVAEECYACAHELYPPVCERGACECNHIGMSPREVAGVVPVNAITLDGGRRYKDQLDKIHSVVTNLVISGSRLRPDGGRRTPSTEADA
eukprot:5755745-Prymnesium_polylepis.1